MDGNDRLHQQTASFAGLYPPADLLDSAGRRWISGRELLQERQAGSHLLQARPSVAAIRQEATGPEDGWRTLSHHRRQPPGEAFALVLMSLFTPARAQTANYHISGATASFTDQLPGASSLGLPPDCRVPPRPTWMQRQFGGSAAARHRGWAWPALLVFVTETGAETG